MLAALHFPELWPTKDSPHSVAKIVQCGDGPSTCIAARREF